MKILINLVTVLAVSALFLCTFLGYAQLSDRLTVEGEVNVSPPEGLSIIHVSPGSFGATSHASNGTVHSSTVDLSVSSSNISTFSITVFNNTGYTYYFDKMVWDESAYDNANIVPKITGMEPKYELKDKSTVTFTVTFSYKNASNITNTVLNSVINYQFVPNKEDAGDIAVNNALEKFREILNDDSLGGAMEVLLDNMDDSGRRANETYIGNVVGADSEDTRAVNDLFTDEIMNYLILQIGDGEAKEVTAIIKREPLDGDSTTGTDIVNGSGTITTAGCEMTMYLTPDDIPDERIFFGGGSSITVYAAVFTTDEDGHWYQLSPLYEGKATTNNYDGNTLFAKANSFNTDTWRSVAGIYETPNGGAVNVQQGKTIGDLVAALPR